MESHFQFLNFSQIYIQSNGRKFTFRKLQMVKIYEFSSIIFEAFKINITGRNYLCARSARITTGHCCRNKNKKCHPHSVSGVQQNLITSMQSPIKLSSEILVARSSSSQILIQNPTRRNLREFVKLERVFKTFFQKNLQPKSLHVHKLTLADLL